MNEDYVKGLQGAPPALDGSTDMAEYERGRQDYNAGKSPQRSMDLTKTYEAAVAVGQEYQQDPNRTLNRMLLRLAGATVIGGLVGFGLATFLGPSWTPSPTAWAIQFAVVTFWLTGVWMWSMLTGVMRHTRRRRGVVVWFVLTLVLGVMLWSFLSTTISGFFL